ncbi:MAG: hypothetical protein PHW08_09330, partial [Kiritimatiellae bacterium]|nr:hypothetical protein [Kiritimatiellia bacterium]
TDWNNAKVRFGDDSHTFDIVLRLFSDMKALRTLKMSGVASGDHTFNLGRLAAGDYAVGVSCTDSEGRSSHTVWQEFRSVGVREENRRDVAAEDLARYGLVPEKDRYAIVGVAVPHAESKDHDVYLSAVKKAAAAVEVPANGYVVFRPEFEGKPVVHGWKRSVVVYGKGYDKAAVAAEALANTAGLQKLVDEAAAEGVTRLVLPKGAVFRVSHTNAVSIPSNLTVDLNGATLKLNGFTGGSSLMVVFKSAHDAHLVNGVVEGDYYEHDYAGSPNASEWVSGVGMEGDCRYTTYENLTIRNITGYGGQNGIQSGNFTFPGRCHLNDGYEPGAIDPATGALVAGLPCQFTSPLRDISAFTNHYLAVSKFLGYQGVRTKSWYYTASFYDADETFISSEVAFQYRIVRIPERAKYLRVTITEDSLEKANSCELTAQFFKIPVNCAFKKIRFERCRAVGLAQSAMRNMLVEDCEFTASGESLATCAYDAEDGWDMMQDVYIHRNRFFDNPRNEFLTCAGHNFIVEDNDCDIYLWGRTLSPCVRNNRFKSAGYYCDSRIRTMHGRYTDNTYSKALTFGMGQKESDWTMVISADLGNADQRFSLRIAQHGVLRNSTVTNADVGSTVDSALGLIESSRFTDCKLNLFQTPFTIRDSSFTQCSIGNLNRTNRFERCSFTDTGLCPVVLSDTTILESAFTNSPIVPNWWSKPNKLTMKKCSVKMDDKSFISTPVYSIDQFLIEDCAFDCGGKSPVTLCDLRQNGHSDPDKIYENRPATLTLARCTVASANAPLISVDRGQKDSEKPLAIAAAGNKAADGSPVAIINNEDIHTTWKVTASAAE